MIKRARIQITSGCTLSMIGDEQAIIHVGHGITYTTYAGLNEKWVITETPSEAMQNLAEATHKYLLEQ